MGSLKIFEGKDSLLRELKRAQYVHLNTLRDIVVGQSAVSAVSLVQV
jgi:hypothetical protein